jgi:hypothetical protein
MMGWDPLTHSAATLLADPEVSESDKNEIIKGLYYGFTQVQMDRIDELLLIHD